jgi:2-oxoglutarate dehydrogenase E2 component (dihydrolipoamide succinyltransferase)
MIGSVDVRAPAEQTEGTRSQVLRWLKAVGDSVGENEPLIELETDKVTVEVAAPASGVLREILKHEQEEIEPGGLLGRIEPAGAVPAAAGESRGSQEASTDGRADIASRGREAGLAQAAGTSPRAGGTDADGRSPARGVVGDRGAARPLSPAVLRLLTEHRLEAADVQGTGADGRVTVQDVLRHGGESGVRKAAPAVHAQPGTTPARPVTDAARSGQAPPAGSSALLRPGAAKPADASLPPSRSVPHSAMRKRIAEHMVESLLHTAPHVTTVFEADMTAVLAHRKRHQEDFTRRGAPLTVTAYFVAAAVVAIRAVPEANARWTDAALEIFDRIEIGIATALEDGGLIVPVLRDAASLDLFGTAQGLATLVARARDGKLQPADVRGGTFTISNHGVSGSLLATPIVINQPQSSILGVGKLQKRPVVVQEQGEERIVVRPMCYVTLTIDHRVMDGQQANRFLAAFTSALERWPAG